VGFERIKIPLIEGLPPNQRLLGANVLIVTDYSTTGAEMLDAIDVITKNGGKVTDVLAFAARHDAIANTAFYTKGVRFHSIIEIPEEIESTGIVLSH
jgi:orotate phosphoribosyltransferase